MGVPIPSTLDLALGGILEQALELNATDLGNIQLLDERTSALVIAAQRGFGPDFLEYFRIVRLRDNCACGRALRLREPVLVEDVASDPGFVAHRRIARSAGFRAVQSIPLIGRHGAFLGVLSTHFRAPRGFTLEEVGKLERHASAAVDTIERLRRTGARAPD
jgi:GAF domain-containing protein